jgi:LmbE family N-acetylglucosaminyl deacetylase
MEIVRALEELRGDVVVASPHLDDAVFSLGAAIASASDAGARVTILTVMACDPSSSRPASSWDRAAGFRTEGDAAATRREEDAAACRIVGADPVWLPFGDHGYGRGAEDDEVWAAVEPHVTGADSVLAPGRPLAHPDHAWLGRLALARVSSNVRLGLYVEQPYGYHAGPSTGGPDLGSGSLRWIGLGVDPRHIRSKRRAVRAYRTQVRRLSDRPLLVRRVVRAERRAGGERIAWVDRRG